MACANDIDEIPDVRTSLSALDDLEVCHSSHISLGFEDGYNPEEELELEVERLTAGISSKVRRKRIETFLQHAYWVSGCDVEWMELPDGTEVPAPWCDTSKAERSLERRAAAFSAIWRTIVAYVAALFQLIAPRAERPSTLAEKILIPTSVQIRMSPAPSRPGPGRAMTYVAG